MLGWRLRRSKGQSVAKVRGPEGEKERKNLIIYYPKISFDVFDQFVIDFRMSGYRLFLAGSLILVNIVLGAVSYEYTSVLQELTNEFLTLHIEISIVS